MSTQTEQALIGSEPEQLHHPAYLTLLREFPEMIEDNARVNQGLAPQTIQFKLTGTILADFVALDPSLTESPGALLLSARLADRELELARWRALSAVPAQPQGQGASALDNAIGTELPELAEDSARVRRGEAPRTELYARTGFLFNWAASLDPGLKQTPGAVLLAGLAARAELYPQSPSDRRLMLATPATMVIQ